MFYKKQQQMNAKNSITRLRLYELKEAAIRGKHLFLKFSEYGTYFRNRKTPVARIATLLKKRP